MTLDDGTIKIYRVANGSKNGEIPRKILVLKEEAYFQEAEIGATRHYEAIKAGEQISCLVIVWDDVDVCTDDVCIINDDIDIQYRVRRVEPTFNRKNLRIKKVTLINNEERYEIIDNYIESD